jgi:hypothetical protein
MQSVNILK